jgi:hypothetical protein
MVPIGSHLPGIDSSEIARDGVERADDGLVIVVRVARHVEGDERGVASHQWRADLRG